MKAFKMSSCCCSDLKTGGLILGYLGTLFWTLASLITIRHPISWYFAIIVIPLVIYISWVYGIHKNNHAFMLPELILNFIYLVLLLTYLFVFSIAALIDRGALEYIGYNNKHFILPGLILGFISALIGPEAREYIEYIHRYDPEIIKIFCVFVLWFLLSILTALQWYFTSVKYSLYMKMKAAAKGLDEPGANCVQELNIYQRTQNI